MAKTLTGVTFFFNADLEPSMSAPFILPLIQKNNWYYCSPVMNTHIVFIWRVKFTHSEIFRYTPSSGMTLVEKIKEKKWIPDIFIKKKILGWREVFLTWKMIAYNTYQLHIRYQDSFHSFRYFLKRWIILEWHLLSSFGMFNRMIYVYCYELWLVWSINSSNWFAFIAPAKRAISLLFWIKIRVGNPATSYSLANLGWKSDVDFGDVNFIGMVFWIGI